MPHPCSYNVSHISPTNPPQFSYPNILGVPILGFHDNSATSYWNSTSEEWMGKNYSYSSTTRSPISDQQTELAESLKALSTIAYFYITPIIIAFGLVGDILSIAVLSHPLLRKTSVVYSYLLALAVTDLLTLISVIPPILWIMKIKFCSLAAALYYAHVGFPLANAFMGASVYIVVFLTFNQYMAVCHPFIRSDFIKSRRTCLVLTLIAYALSFALYVPWAWRKNVRYVANLHWTFENCPYEACDNHNVVDSFWYKAYQWAREMISRFIPFLFIAYFNLRMLYVYRRTRAQRMSVVSLREQKLTLRQKMEREQRRLWALLFGIMTLFFVCTIPAAPFTIMVSDRLEHNLTFQTVRAITNVLEFTKFALNFYLYCMINPDIRRLCLKRLMCQSSINTLKAPMVASRNSYHLSDLLQMSERKHPHKQLPQHYNSRKSCATGISTTGSCDRNSYRSRRSVRSRQESEKPLLAVTTRRNAPGNRYGEGERNSADEHDESMRNSKASPSATMAAQALPAVQQEKERNGNAGRAICKSDTDIILHGEPANPSISWLSFSSMFNDELCDHDLDCDQLTADCQKCKNVISKI